MNRSDRNHRQTHAARARDAGKQKGFALIEVLVSILLFSLGILGLIGLQSRAIGFSVDAEDRNRAALLANEIASVMWLNRSVIVPAATLATWQSKVADPTGSGLSNGVGTVTNVSTNTADVLITWRTPARVTGDASSQLSTRVTINLP